MNPCTIIFVLCYLKIIVLRSGRTEIRLCVTTTVSMQPAGSQRQGWGVHRDPRAHGAEFRSGNSFLQMPGLDIRSGPQGDLSALSHLRRVMGRFLETHPHPGQNLYSNQIAGISCILQCEMP